MFAVFLIVAPQCSIDVYENIWIEDCPIGRNEVRLLQYSD